jgi:hypothetical protein
MKLFNLLTLNLFKKKEYKVEEVPDYDIEDLKKIKKKNRKRALRLLKEYKQGLVIEIDKNINQKQLMDSIRKGL